MARLGRRLGGNLTADGDTQHSGRDRRCAEADAHTLNEHIEVDSLAGAAG